MQEDMTQEEIDAILKGAGGAADVQPDINPASAEAAADMSSSDIPEPPSQGAVPGTGGISAGQQQDAGFQNPPGGSPGTVPIERSNIGVLLDIPLNVSVELGRTKIAVKDMLQLGPGSVIELDKLIGEPVDLLVNEKLIARGEVVVFDESFGIRITDIVNPEDRIKSLG